MSDIDILKYYTIINNNIDLIIAYYKEDLDWLNNYKHINFRYIFIYNKGDQQIPNINRPFIEIKLDNIGKCDHTYLYHIITNYNNLADVTIFTPGSVSLKKRKDKFNIIVNQTITTLNSVFIAFIYNNVSKDLYDFNIDYYSCSYDNNNSINDLDNNLCLSHIRPFGLWYNTYFNNIIINNVNYGGMFSVSRQHIKQHNLNYYKNLINQFPNHKNPEIGHYFERAWLAVFYLIPNNCIILY